MISLKAQNREDSKMFSQRQVAVGTLLGSPIAGGILMALNHRAWDQSSEIKECLVSLALIPKTIW